MIIATAPDSFMEYHFVNGQIRNEASTIILPSSGPFDFFDATVARIAPDGGALVSAKIGIPYTHREIVLQLLNSRGKPTGSYRIIRRGFSGDEEVSLMAGSPSVTRILSGSRRFVSYIWAFPNYHGAFAGVWLQKIDAANGKNLGKPVLIYRDNGAASVEEAVIDPLGRFIVFSFGDNLAFQALDAQGRKAGNFKILSREHSPYNRIVGIDLLKN